MVFKPLQHANMSKSERAAAFKSHTDSCARTLRLRAEALLAGLAAASCAAAVIGNKKTRKSKR